MARHLILSGDHLYRCDTIKQAAAKIGIKQIDIVSEDKPSLHIFCSNSTPQPEHHIWCRNAKHKNFEEEFKYAKDECKKYNLRCVVVHHVDTVSKMTKFHLVVTQDSGIQSFQSEADVHRYLCEYVQNHKGYSNV